MIGSAFCFSVMSLFVKLAGQTQPSQQIVLARCVSSLVLSALALKQMGLSLWGPKEARGLLCLRGALGFGGLTCFYWSVTHLPLADATIIQFLHPLIVGILAAFFLGEKLTWRAAVGVGVSLGGLALITQPAWLFGGDHARLDPFDVGVAFLGAFVTACAYTSVRALGRRADPMVVVFYFPLIATPLALPAAWPVLTWPTPTGWVCLAGVGISTQVAQILMTKGLHQEAAGRATSITYLQVVFAMGWGGVAFGEWPGGLALVGSVAIVASSLWIALSRQAETAGVEGQGDAVKRPL